jgi:hypothetical protein
MCLELLAGAALKRRPEKVAADLKCFRPAGKKNWAADKAEWARFSGLDDVRPKYEEFLGFYLGRRKVKQSDWLELEDGRSGEDVNIFDELIREEVQEENLRERVGMRWLGRLQSVRKVMSETQGDSVWAKVAVWRCVEWRDALLRCPVFKPRSRSFVWLRCDNYDGTDENGLRVLARPHMVKHPRQKDGSYCLNRYLRKKHAAYGVSPKEKFLY